MTFDPTQHLIKVQGGSEYLEVKWRLVWLHEKHPDASVETELVRIDGDTVLMRAEVTIPWDDGKVSKFSGYASGKLDGRFPAIETAETSAIGRALAHAGLGTQFAGHDVSESNVVDSPVTRQPRPQRDDVEAMRDEVQAELRRQTQTAGQASVDSPAAGEPLTGAQESFIKRLAKEQHMDEDGLADFISANYGGRDLHNLTKREASELISLWKRAQPA